MKKILFAWIGMTDLNAAADNSSDLGPIGQAVTSDLYDHVILLSDHKKSVGQRYIKWLQKQCSSTCELISAALTSPTDFGGIYECTIKTLKNTRKRFDLKYDYVFHLSPGTPAMAAVWIIISKTRFPATLLESSKIHGVRITSIPFDISADYLPDLLRKPDNELIRLSQGLSPEAPEFDAIIHRCTIMKRLIAKARRVAPRNIPVLLMGESGTGKELLARAIHNTSSCHKGPLAVVNCGAIPTELVESELFGHEKGAFTGAVSEKKGYIEEASGGTLFLDEIGELPRVAQVKLLRVLQEQQVIRVGATKSRKVNFRVIAATNRNLMQEVAESRFREDLFHRIAVAVLHIPPLREREGDITILVDYLLKQINEESTMQPGFEHKKLSVSARKLLISHVWPGNIRELHNVLQRVAVWSVGTTIEIQDIREAILPMPRKTSRDMLGRSMEEGFDLQGLMTELAHHYLLRALEESHGNKTKAATLLGLPSYQTLTNWLQRYGITGG